MDQTNADQTSEKPTLQEGVNYRLIPGKHKNSKLIIVGNYAYKLEKLDKNVLYLFCKFPSCKARAKIKGNVFYSTSGSKVPHTCQSRGACAEFWEAHEALSRMKYRAELETTSYRIIYDEELQNKSVRVHERVNFLRARKSMQDARAKARNAMRDARARARNSVQDGEVSNLVPGARPIGRKSTQGGRARARNSVQVSGAIVSNAVQGAEAVSGISTQDSDAEAGSPFPASSSNTFDVAKFGCGLCNSDVSNSDGGKLCFDSYIEARIHLTDVHNITTSVENLDQFIVAPAAPFLQQITCKLCSQQLTGMSDENLQIHFRQAHAAPFLPQLLKASCLICNFSGLNLTDHIDSAHPSSSFWMDPTAAEFNSDLQDSKEETFKFLKSAGTPLNAQPPGKRRRLVQTGHHDQRGNFVFVECNVTFEEDSGERKND